MIDDIYISLDDFKRLYQKKRHKLLSTLLWGSVLCFAYFLLIPPSYEAVATFKQSASQGEHRSDFKNFIRTFYSGGSEEGAAIPIILSRAVLTKTVEELGLQAIVEQQGYWGKKLTALKNNLLSEIQSAPDATDDEKEFGFEQVRYEGENPAYYSLRFINPSTFEILNRLHQRVGVGELGVLASVEKASFRLVKTPRCFKQGSLYSLTLLPKRLVIEDVKNRIAIKPLREEKNILMLKFKDTRPQRAALFVNTLMEKYGEYLVEENRAVIGAQLKYLDRRQDELSHKLDADMKDHVALLKRSLEEQGFMGMQEELGSILEPLQNYRSRLHEIEVEMAGLEKRSSLAAVPSHRSTYDLKLVHQLTHSLTEQMQDTALALEKLCQEDSLPLFSHPTFASLIQDYEQAKQLWQNATEQEKEVQHRLYQEKRSCLATHLQNYLSHLSARQKNLSESSAYIDHLETDFRGMSLEASRQLFQNYCHDLDHLHAHLKQVIFFRDNLHEPHFEISTLSNILNDTVTQQLVQKSSEVESQLCDLINRSGKEHTRLKETLSMQKKFLEAHLNQLLELGKIRIQLIKEKISSLYEVMKNLLHKEKEVVQSKIEEIKKNLREVPELWHLEKQLHFKAQLTKGMMEGLTQVAESKNLSRYLYQVESKTLDKALPPLKPKSHSLILKSVAGGLGMSAVFYFFSLALALAKGLPLSLTTLRMMGLQTVGTLSTQAAIAFPKLSSEDLEVLRSMTSFLLEKKDKPGRVVALLSERGTGFCYNLAHLLAFHQQKVALIDCNFERIIASEDQPGLWHYLHHALSEIPFRQKENYDFLPCGGNSRHAVELLSSSRFKDLLTQCRAQYDFIFLLRQASLTSQDALHTLEQSDLAIITTYDESQASLAPYVHRSEQKENHRLTFAQYSIVPE